MTDAELIEFLKQKKEIVIVGAGDIGEYLWQLLKAVCEGTIITICDNAHKKQKKNKDFEVWSVGNTVALFPHAIYVLTSRIHEFTMTSQLREMGILQENILPGVTAEAQNYMTEKKRAVKFHPLEKLQFEVDLTAHCNLNCRCCSQFSCIAEEEYMDIEEMERDFQRLSSLFQGEVRYLYLIGGEPLLHPQINECICIARRYFPTGKVAVFTNGMLLLRMGDRFWSNCRENCITIIVTKYPIGLDYRSIIKKAESENVAFEFFGSSQDYKYMTNLGLSLTGKQDITESFSNCVEANNCVKLRKGKLYTCTRPVAIYRFNKFFGEQLEVSEEDYIDIYKASTKEEILDRLANPIPFCRYCDILGERKAMNWGKTEKQIEEWL